MPELVEYVLNQMVDNGFISEALATKTGLLGLELRTHSLTLSADNQHFVDEVRRQLIEEYGEEKIKTAGYTVRTTLDVFRQSKAMSALRNGLKAVDKRRKYGQVLQR